MYVPGRFSWDDESEILEFLCEDSFGCIVTSANGVPVATHLPFAIREQDGEIHLVSHLARANEHWRSIGAGESLVVFQGPHAYVSPSSYLDDLNVPTWNYIAVHAYGAGVVHERPEDVLRTLESMIHYFEPAYLKQWDALPGSYKQAMVQRIVAIDIRVSRLESKMKLSQDRRRQEQRAIANAIAGSSGADHALGAYMRRCLDNDSD